MTDKTIHIVFQVLNFLSSNDSIEYNLTADEQLLLIFLSKHQGEKGIYPSINTLAREIKRSHSAIQRTLTRLQKKNLILINYQPGKSSYYTLILPQKLSTTPSVDATTNPPLPLACTLPHPSRRRYDTPSVDATQSVKRNNPMKNTEREALSDLSIFEPDEASTILCSDLRLDMTVELQSFRERHKGKKTQYEFQRWLKSAKEYAERKSGKAIAQAEPYSAVNRMPFFESTRKQEIGKPVTVDKIIGFQEQLEILRKQGSRPNGKDFNSDSTGNHCRRSDSA